MEAGRAALLDVELCYSTEWDEFWSYVGSKANQRWTWYIVERQGGRIVAWENGRRKDGYSKGCRGRSGPGPAPEVLPYGRLGGLPQVPAGTPSPQGGQGLHMEDREEERQRPTA